QLSVSVSLVFGVEPVPVNSRSTPTEANNGLLVMTGLGVVSTTTTVTGFATPTLPNLSVIVNAIWYVPSSSGVNVRELSRPVCVVNGLPFLRPLQAYVSGPARFGSLTTLLALTGTPS